MGTDYTHEDASASSDDTSLTKRHQAVIIGSDPIEDASASSDGTDLTKRHQAVIIGAGPVGLFAIFQLGLLDISCCLIDTLEQPGGQCAQLYPDKPIYDIPGYPSINGQDLVYKLLEQARPFKPVFYLNQQVISIRKEGALWKVQTSMGLLIEADIVILASGQGVFMPRKLDVKQDLSRYEGKQILYSVRDKSIFNGKNIGITGGGDAAADWCLELAGKAGSITLITRRAELRAMRASAGRIYKLIEDGTIAHEIGQIRQINPGKQTCLEVQVAGASMNAASMNAASMNAASMNATSMSATSMNDTTSMNAASMNATSMNDTTSMNATSMSATSMSATSMSATSMSATSMNDTTSMNATSMSATSMNAASMNATSMSATSMNDTTSMNATSMNATSMNATSMSATSMNATSMSATSMNDTTSMNATSMSATSMNATSMSATSMSATSMNDTTSMNATSMNAASMSATSMNDTTSMNATSMSATSMNDTTSMNATSMNAASMNDTTSMSATSMSATSTIAATSQTIAASTSLDLDYLLVFYGMHVNMRALQHIGAEMYCNYFVVNTENCQTSIEGLFAIGDANYYPGKLRLILSGFHDAAMMAQKAFNYVYPGLKLMFRYTTIDGRLHEKINNSKS